MSKSITPPPDPSTVTENVMSIRLEIDKPVGDQSSELIHCPICNKNEILNIGPLRNNVSFAGQLIKKPIFGGKLYHCSNCLIGFRHPILSMSEYTELYDNQKTEQWISESIRTDQRNILNRIKHNFGSRPRILDIGCNTGELLAAAPDSALKFGVEINSAAAAIASSRGITTYSSLQDIPQPDKFDIIILCDVIEHVENPSSLILSLFEHLNSGGEILVSTGDFDAPARQWFGSNWWYCSYSEHIRFISERWARYLCTKNPITFETIARFKYSKHSPARLTRDFALMATFGFFPKAYLWAGSLLKSIAGKSGDVPIMGAGITEDHILLSFRVADEN